VFAKCFEVREKLQSFPFVFFASKKENKKLQFPSWSGYSPMDIIADPTANYHEQNTASNATSNNEKKPPHGVVFFWGRTLGISRRTDRRHQ
jgi:hypothetical protein